MPSLAQHPSTLIMRTLHGQRAIIAARVVVELDTFSSLVSQDHRRKTHHYGRWQMAHLPVETLQGGSKERNETNSSRVICNGKKRSRHVFSSPTILQGRVSGEEGKRAIWSRYYFLFTVLYLELNVCLSIQVKETTAVHKIYNLQIWIFRPILHANH